MLRLVLRLRLNQHSVIDIERHEYSIDPLRARVVYPQEQIKGQIFATGNKDETVSKVGLSNRSFPHP